MHHSALMRMLQSLSRLLPTGLAAKLLETGRAVGETERLTVTVLMSDIRGYSTIAEHADPAALAGEEQYHQAPADSLSASADGPNGRLPLRAAAWYSVSRRVQETS